MEINVRVIILSSQDYKDKDRFYYILTLEKGLIRAFSKSVRASSSKLSGFLLPGNEVFLMLATNKEFNKIVQVKVIKARNFFVDYKIFIIFNQVVKILINIIFPNFSEKEIYQNTSLFFNDLNSKDLNIIQKRNLKLAYYADLLKKTGFRPQEIDLPVLLVKLLKLMLENDYLKNRELMLKLKLKDKDFLMINNYFASCFESILEKEVNFKYQ
ncbi:recombination protein O N-terminal domain-containing protein [bacterium]|nr:recombination protein O N-terminal domain-containing protein [bacterium]